MYIPATYWYDPCQSAAQTIRRLRTPLHYHLRRHDYVAFHKELSSGTNPFILDECGRTPLDLAFLMLEDTLITALCTSFPVDFLVKTLEYDNKYPAKFHPRYNEVYENMYDHPNALRLASENQGGYGGQPCSSGHFGTGAPEQFPRFTPISFPSYQHETLPTHLYDPLYVTVKKRVMDQNKNETKNTTKEKHVSSSSTPMKKHEHVLSQKKQNKKENIKQRHQGMVHNNNSNSNPSSSSPSPKISSFKKDLELKKNVSNQKDSIKTQQRRGSSSNTTSSLSESDTSTSSSSNSRIDTRYNSQKNANHKKHNESEEENKKGKQQKKEENKKGKQQKEEENKKGKQQKKEENKKGKQQKEEENDHDITLVPKILRPPNASKLQALFQDQMLIVVEDAIKQPTRRSVQRRMSQLLSEFRGLFRVINLMSTCEPLKVQAMQFRMSIARRPQNLNNEIPFYVFENLTYPYLFLATLQNLFEMYPYNSHQKPWNTKDVADARRLTNLVMYKRLKGHEVLHFLCQLPQYICHYIVLLGPDFFKPSAELAQFLMYYAFCVDSSELFYFASRTSRPFSIEDLFDWDNLIRILSLYKKKFAKFLIPLITCRLKERIHERLSQDATTDAKATKKNKRSKISSIQQQSKNNPLPYPFEEKYLTQEFIKEFAQLFGSNDVRELENTLGWWRLEVARMFEEACPPPCRFPAGTYVSSASVIPPPTPMPLHLRTKTCSRDKDTTTDEKTHQDYHGDSRVYPRFMKN